MKTTLKRELVDASFIVPALLFFGLFLILPILMGIPMSLLEWNGFSPKARFIGLGNFQRILSDPTVPGALSHTVQFAVGAVVLSNTLGLFMAVLLQKSTRFNNIIRTLVFMPFVISVVLSSFIWSYIYADVITPLFGLPSPLGRPDWVMLGIVIICVWRDAGYCMIIYLAALQTIPKDYYEVGLLEGISPWQQFRKITLPLIGPAITANLTLTLSWGLKVFGYIFAATGGGPGRASESINVLIYNNIFVYFKAGYGQAQAIVFAVIVFLITRLMNSALRRKEVEY